MLQRAVSDVSIYGSTDRLLAAAQAPVKQLQLGRLALVVGDSSCSELAMLLRPGNMRPNNASTHTTLARQVLERDLGVNAHRLDEKALCRIDEGECTLAFRKWLGAIEAIGRTV